MFIAFAFEAAGIILLATFATNPVMFVVLSGIVFFGWGEIYSLFPATCTDTYGSKFATVNAGLLYTAKGTAALVIPYTSIWAKASGWHPVFMTAAALNILAAVMALLILKPMRSQYTSKTAVLGECAKARYLTFARMQRPRPAIQVTAKFALGCSDMTLTLVGSCMEQPRAGEAPQCRDRITGFNVGGRHARHRS